MSFVSSCTLHTLYILSLEYIVIDYQGWFTYRYDHCINNFGFFWSLCAFIWVVNMTSASPSGQIGEVPAPKSHAVAPYIQHTACQSDQSFTVSSLPVNHTVKAGIYSGVSVSILHLCLLLKKSKECHCMRGFNEKILLSHSISQSLFFSDARSNHSFKLHNMDFYWSQNEKL